MPGELFMYESLGARQQKLAKSGLSAKSACESAALHRTSRAREMKPQKTSGCGSSVAMHGHVGERFQPRRIMNGRPFGAEGGRPRPMSLDRPRWGFGGSDGVGVDSIQAGEKGGPEASAGARLGGRLGGEFGWDG